MGKVKMTKLDHIKQQAHKLSLTRKEVLVLMNEITKTTEELRKLGATVAGDFSDGFAVTLPVEDLISPDLHKEWIGES